MRWVDRVAVQTGVGREYAFIADRGLTSALSSFVDTNLVIAQPSVAVLGVGIFELDLRRLTQSVTASLHREYQ